jgi:hypothetical protein
VGLLRNDFSVVRDNGGSWDCVVYIETWSPWSEITYF